MQMRVINLFLCSNNTLELKYYMYARKKHKSTRSDGLPARRGRSPARSVRRANEPCLAAMGADEGRGGGRVVLLVDRHNRGGQKSIRHLVIRNRGTLRPHCTAITPGTQSHSTPPTPNLFR
jgi:hypothetical protein